MTVCLIGKRAIYEDVEVTLLHRHHVFAIPRPRCVGECLIGLLANMLILPPKPCQVSDNMAVLRSIRINFSQQLWT